MPRAVVGYSIALLMLSLSGCVSVPQVEQRLAALEFHANMYVVQAGDTFESVAWRYKLDPAELARLNPGLGVHLQPGMRINVHPGTTLADNLRNRNSMAALPQSRSSAPSQSDEVTVSRVEPRQALRSEATGQARFPVEQLTEIQASARTDNQLLEQRPPLESRWERLPAANAPQRDTRSASNPWPFEEVIEDDLPAIEQLAVNQGNAAFAPAESAQVFSQSIAGAWVWPTRGEVARGFEPSRIGGQGVDIAGVPGQDVRAAKSGKVVYSGRDLSGGGNLVIVQHDKNLMTTYSHADKLFVAEDDLVEAGDPIASLGWNSKRESVLRFEVRRDGKPLNPMNFLPGS